MLAVFCAVSGKTIRDVTQFESRQKGNHGIICFTRILLG